MDTETFLKLWEDIRKVFDETIKKYDSAWMVRKRTIDTRFLIFFIMKAIIPKDHRGYGVTLVEIFNQFLNFGIPSISKKALAPSSVCEARQKLDHTIFNELNAKIIEKWEKYTEEPRLWHGHRLYGVDGSLFNLPRELIDQGYKTPGEHVYYPQGLVSGVYDLLNGIPYDFDLVSHNNERTCAIRHLEQGFQRNAVNVYDRGYFSFELLASHVKYDAHPVFRLQSNTGYKVIEEFWISEKTDEIVILQPPSAILRAVKKGELNIDINPIEVRLIKYTIGERIYVLCTTLKDRKKYPEEIFPGVYHSRWGFEEMIKVSKIITGVQDFHAKTERGVKQELFAHFLLITLMKIIESQSYQEIKEERKLKEAPKRRLRGINSHKKSNVNTKSKLESEAEKVKINTKNSFLACGVALIKLLYFETSEFLRKGLEDLQQSSKRLYQSVRPGRTYPRKSKQSVNKWCRV